jgi:purine-binding chemotaxis protein CheW
MMCESGTRRRTQPLGKDTMDTTTPTSARLAAEDFPANAHDYQRALAGQYLTLRLGDEDYAIDILRVQEIRSYEQPTKMVNSPSFIKGVINLRGVIVPIVDLRLKLHIGKAEYTGFTVVIILSIHGTVVGAVVDAVSDVVTLSAEMIKAAPQFDSGIEARFVLGLAHIAERTLIVMDMQTLLSHAELGISSK